MGTKKWLFVGILALCSLRVATAGEPAVHPTTGEPLVVTCLRGTPDAIDGDLSDWNLAAMTPAVLDVAGQLYTGQASWTNAEDCSGQFYLLWDDEKIYMAVVVKDDKLSMTKTGGDIWNADCIEVFFSAPEAVAAHSATTHYQYGFNANNQRWNWCNMDGTGATEPTYLQVASSQTEDGYICEVSIEYKRMLSLDFVAGNAIGFHPVIDDTEATDREIQMTWTSREAHDQSQGFGHLILSSDAAGATAFSYSPTPSRGAINVPIGTILSWKTGKFAASHDVYFGTALDAVTEATRDNPMDVLVSQGQTATEFHPTDLAYGKTYYWRVDEVNAPPDSTICKGNVWSFTIQSQTAWKPYPPDGMKNVDLEQDLSWQKGMGALFHMIYFGDDFEKVSSIPAGGWMSVTAAYDPGTLQLDKTYYWRVDEFTGPVTRKGPVWSFTTRGSGGGVKAQYFKGMALAGDPILTQTEGSIDHSWAGEIAAGLADSVSARWTANLQVPFTESYRLITTSDDGVRLWLDGRLVIDNWTDHGTTDNSTKADLIVGQNYSIRMEYYDNTGGAVAQLSWESASLPRQIIPQGWLQLPLWATSPSPTNGSPHAVQNAPLQWLAGDEATHHDVYFGDNAEAVANADSSTTGIYQGRQAVAENTFDPGPLEWNKTYYWRVDEINTANADSPWKGAVWSFTTADFVIVEDFESYTDDEGSEIFSTWIDGWADSSSGSRVGYLNPPFAERTIVNSGWQSMPLDYNNVNSPYFSEAQRTWDAAQNWTVNGVDTLTLYFRGAARNDAEKLYVALQDSAGKTAVAVNPNPDAARATKWTEWKVPLSSFAGVNAAKIKKMTIGLGDQASPKQGGAGIVYIDDIRVTKP